VGRELHRKGAIVGDDRATQLLDSQPLICKMQDIMISRLAAERFTDLEHGELVINHRRNDHRSVVLLHFTEHR